MDCKLRMDDSPLHRFPNFPGGTWPGDGPPDSRASACILQLRLNDVCRMVWLAGQFTSSYVSTSKSLQRESVPICCAPTNLEGVQSQGYMGVLHMRKVPQHAPYVLTLHILSREVVDDDINYSTCT